MCVYFCVRVLFPIIPRIKKKKNKLTFSSSSSSFHTRETFSSRLFLSISHFLSIFCNPQLSLYYYCNYYYDVRYGYNYIFTYNSLYYV